MNEIIKINNLNFVKIEKPDNKFNFKDLIKKIYNKEKLNDFEINKIWCIVAFFIVISFLIYELYNLQYLK